MVTNSTLLNLLNSGDFDKLHDAIMNNIREESLKASGRKTNILTIIKRITSDKNHNNESLRQAHEFTYNNRTMYAFTNGYMLLASEDDYKYNHAEKPLQIAQIVDTSICDTSITLNKADILAYTKTIKRTDKKPYIIKTDKYYIGFNAFYMLDAMNFTGCDTIQYCSKNICGCYKNSIYLINEAENKIAIVLPINIGAAPDYINLDLSTPAKDQETTPTIEEIKEATPTAQGIEETTPATESEDIKAPADSTDTKENTPGDTVEATPQVETPAATPASKIKINIDNMQYMDIKAYKTSIKVFEDGKTRAIINNLTRFKTLQPNKQILYSKALRSSGIWGNNKIDINNCYVKDNKLYYFRNMNSYKYFTDAEKQAIDQFYLDAEQYNIKIIPCYFVA